MHRLERSVVAVILALHGIAHLAVYPVSGDSGSTHRSSSFWIAPSLARNAAGYTARVLLVVAAVAFVLAAVDVVRPIRRVAAPLLVAIGGLSSVSAVVLLWGRLHPRPDTLWVGPVLSAAILAVTVAVVRRRGSAGTPPPRDDARP
ncbi:MAG: hypothetical protein U0Q22_01830 [Acidimicrobiales bacterium]